MRECEMFEPMKELLESKGYTVVLQNIGRKRGADIVAERDGCRLVMEMKGDSAALGVDLGTAILQLLRHMKADSDDEYALGVSEAYIKLMDDLQFPLKRLGIRVFVVGCESYQLW